MQFFNNNKKVYYIYYAQQSFCIIEYFNYFCLKYNNNFAKYIIKQSNICYFYNILKSKIYLYIKAKVLIIIKFLISNLKSIKCKICKRFCLKILINLIQYSYLEIVLIIKLLLKLKSCFFKFVEKLALQ